MSHKYSDRIFFKLLRKNQRQSVCPVAEFQDKLSTPLPNLITWTASKLGGK